MSANQDPWVMKDEAIAAARSASDPPDVFSAAVFAEVGELVRRDEAGRPRDPSIRDVLARLEEIEGLLNAIGSDVARLMERS